MVIITVVIMLFLGVIALVIRNFPSYKWNYTCRSLFEHFENGVLSDVHNLIDSTGPELTRMFETSCLETIDREFRRFKEKYNSFLLLESCIRQHERTYKQEILNHIMRNKHKYEF